MMASGGKYENWFSSRIEELVNRFSDKQTILAFAGLSPVQATLLSRNVNALDGIVSSSESDVGSHNPFEFSEKKKKAFFDITQSDGVVVCLYEQLVVLRESLHNLYDGRIVVGACKILCVSPRKGQRLRRRSSPAQGAGHATMAAAWPAADWRRP